MIKENTCALNDYLPQQIPLNCNTILIKTIILNAFIIVDISLLGR